MANKSTRVNFVNFKLLYIPKVKKDLQLEILFLELFLKLKRPLVSEKLKKFIQEVYNVSYQ